MVHNHIQSLSLLYCGLVHTALNMFLNPPTPSHVSPIPGHHHQFHPGHPRSHHGHHLPGRGHQCPRLYGQPHRCPPRCQRSRCVCLCLSQGVLYVVVMRVCNSVFVCTSDSFSVIDMGAIPNLCVCVLQVWGTWLSLIL